MTDIVRHVMTGGLKLAIAGIVLGAALALALGRWIEPLLLEESPRDPMVFMLVAGVLLFVAVLASFIPASRAAQVDPMLALRSD
jgi:ABC-type lipoprotein release transport system permease subunit